MKIKDLFTPLILQSKIFTGPKSDRPREKRIRHSGGVLGGNGV